MYKWRRLSIGYFSNVPRDIARRWLGDRSGCIDEALIQDNLPEDQVVERLHEICLGRRHQTPQALLLGRGIGLKCDIGKSMWGEICSSGCGEESVGMSGLSGKVGLGQNFRRYCHSQPAKRTEPTDPNELTSQSYHT
jgi:hypothetical protein